MTALAIDVGPRTFAFELPRHQRRPSLGVVPAATRLFFTSICMQAAGKAVPVVSGTAMAALCKTFAGGDANSGLIVSARNANVRVALTSGAAESIAVTLGATEDIAITYNNGTSTPNSLLQLIRGHAEANRILRAKATGTGAGTALVAVLIANGAVPHIAILGVPTVPIDNSAGVGDLTLGPAVAFDCGTFAANADPSNIPAEGTWASILDDNTYSSSVADPLALQVPIRYVNDPRGFVYGDLAEAR